VPWDSDGFKAPTKDFIDGLEYDARKPNAYIASLAIGLKGQQKIEGADVVGK
jgi:nitrate/nitrite transport system substrate-binding protein